MTHKKRAIHKKSENKKMLSIRKNDFFQDYT